MVVLVRKVNLPNAPIAQMRPGGLGLRATVAFGEATSTLFLSLALSLCSSAFFAGMLCALENSTRPGSCAGASRVSSDS